MGERNFKDGQSFNRLWINDHQYYMVGMGHVTLIEVVMEHGPGAMIPYFAIWTEAGNQMSLAAKYAAHAVTGVVNYPLTDDIAENDMEDHEIKFEDKP